MKNIKNLIINLIDKYVIFRKKRNEIKKFQDSRRKKIYNNTKLTKIQKNEIDSLYKCYYGCKIPYTWHRHYYAFTGRFDKRYFPELLYIPEFEHYMNYNKAYCKVFSDKNVLPIIAKSAKVEMPKSIISCLFRHI